MRYYIPTNEVDYTLPLGSFEKVAHILIIRFRPCLHMQPIADRLLL